jgi:hypothetical protein
VSNVANDDNACLEPLNDGAAEAQAAQAAAKSVSAKAGKKQLKLF